MDLAWHPSRLLLVSVSTSGKVYIWAPIHDENWSAFAPDFKVGGCGRGGGGGCLEELAWVWRGGVLAGVEEGTGSVRGNARWLGGCGL